MNHHNDFFRIYDGSTVAAESFHTSMACDHADRIAAHNGSPRIVLVTENGETETSLPVNRKNHTCTAACRRRRLIDQ